MIKKTIPFILVLMLAFFGACSNEDVMPQVDSELTGRTITFTASMPDEDGPSTRISAEEAIDGTIGLIWNTDDKIDLLFVQGDNKIHKTTNVTNITEGGKKGSFTIVIPGDIRDGEAFDLYGVYGGGEVGANGNIGVAAQTAEGNVGKNIMLRFKTAVDATGAMGPVNFQHVGFLFTAKVKVTNVDININNITDINIFATDNLDWIYKASDYEFNIETGAFTTIATATASNAAFFGHKVIDGDMLTVRSWFPKADAAWPALKLNFKDGTTDVVSTTQKSAGNTPAVGNAYYIYATYDGTDLEFASKSDMEPKGSKENPYTVAQAFANQGDPKNTDYVWVKGYIVGYKNNGGYDVEFSIVGASGTNIVIADNVDEADGTKALGVQLPAGAARTNLNLASNPYMYKAEVLLYGTLEKYFGSDEGLKNVEEYEILSTTPLFQADNTPINFTSSLELTRTISITTNDTQAWTATSDEAWLTVTPASGTGSGDVTITATENTDTEAGRTATVTLTPIDNAELSPIVIDVTQEALAPYISVDPTSLSFTTASGQKELTVQSNVYWIAGVTINVGDAGWLTISPDETTGDGAITVTATENTTFEIRSATINITDGEDISININIAQEAVIPYITIVGEPTLGFEAIGGNQTVTIESNTTWMTEVSVDATWLSATPEIEEGNAIITVTAASNDAAGSTPRSGIITISDGEEATKTVVVTQAGTGAPVPATDLFFSEYIEGSGSNNKGLEIYNGTGAAIDLSDYKVELYANGSSVVSQSVVLSGTLQHGEVVVIENKKGTLYNGDALTIISPSVCNFNGDDAIALRKISTSEYIDIFGEIGTDPGSAWTATGFSTADMTLVRKPDVKSGVTTNPSKGFPTLATEWIGYPKDTATYLGSHTTNY